MIDLVHFRDLILAPTLAFLDTADPGIASRAAEELLLGTLVTESGGRALRQYGTGPARSLFQIEPRTADDIQRNWIAHRPRLRARIDALVAPWPAGIGDQITGNLAFATALARLVYRRASAPLPQPGDGPAMGRYWKRWYNTPAGAGRAETFTALFARHVAPLYRAP